MRTNNTIHWGLRIPGLGTATGSQWKLASWICISSPLLVICVTSCPCERCLIYDPEGEDKDSLLGH